MIEPQPKERVLVRKQGSPFLAYLTGSVRLDVRKEGHPELLPGPEIAVEVRDDRGFILYAQRTQIEPATKAHEEEFATDTGPRLIQSSRLFPAAAN